MIDLMPATDMIWCHADPASRQRFAASMLVDDADRCWIWTGGLEPDSGYGRFRPPHPPVIAAHT